MKTRLKRLLSGVLALAMVVAMLPTMGLSAFAYDDEEPCPFCGHPAGNHKINEGTITRCHSCEIDMEEGGMGPCPCLNKQWVTDEPAPTHKATDTYGKDGTNHWFTCAVQGCTEHTYEETAHDFSQGDCVCGQKKVAPVLKSEVIHFNNAITAESDHFSLTCGKCNKNGWFISYYDGHIVITAKADDVIIMNIDAIIGYNPQNYGQISYSSGTKQEDSGDGLNKGSTVHVTDINSNELTITTSGAGYTVEFKDITVYYMEKEPAPTHKATTTYGKDGTNHWFTCAVEGCTEKFNETAHSYTNGDCVCGKTCLHNWADQDGVCPICNKHCTHDWSDENGSCSICWMNCPHTEGIENGKCKTCGVEGMATVDLLAKMDGAYYVDAENGTTITVAKDASGNITGLILAASGEKLEISIEELGNLSTCIGFNDEFDADMYRSTGLIFLVDENGNIPFVGGEYPFVRTEFVDSSLPLGDNLTVTIGENTFYFVPNADEADEDYEGLYRQVDETALDFDYYKWANDGDNLRATARKEMDESESATDLTIQTINGVAVATYEDQEEGYSTLTAIFDGGNYYAELVFYYADGTEKAQAQAIIDSVTGYQAVKAESFNMDCVELTTTGYYQGHDVDLDTASGQTGYYYNFTNDVDFDTYEWDVDVDDTNLQSAVINDINKSHAGQNVTPVYTTINGVPVAYYDAIDTVTEGEEQVQYKTRTYLLLVDGIFYEYVFYTENAADVKIAEGIMNTLAGVESEHSYEENGKHSWVNVDNAFSLNYEVACVKCGMKGTKKAVISKESSAGKTTYTATTPEGNTYTKTVVEKIGVTYQGETTQYDFATILTLTADTEVDWLANGVKVGAGSKTYTFAVTKDVVIATEEASEPEPIVRLNVDRSNAAKAVLSLEWTMPKGYTLVEAGIYRNLNMTETQLDATAPKVSTLKTTNGTYELTMNLSAASRGKDVSTKGYIKYRTPSGETKTMQTAFQRVANQ